MASTFSQNLRLELIASGEQTGVWGNTTNNNLGDLIEQAVSGATDLNVTSGDITLTALNGVVDQARSAVLSIVGSAGVTRTVTIPNVPKAYTVKNRSDATINLKTASGSEFEIPTLSEAYVYCNGDDVITGRVITDGANAVNSLPDPFNNAALTGVPTAPTASLGTDTTQVATTAFVQDALQAVYPVGSVYINADSATNPSTLFGFGTWAAIGAGRVLVGQDTGDALFNNLGNTGGSKDATLVSHSHTGSGNTGNNNVGHNHGFSGNTGNNNVGHVHSGSTNDHAGHQHIVPNTFGNNYSQAGINWQAATGTTSDKAGRGAVATNPNRLSSMAGAHNHSFTTGGQSANHHHGFSGTTNNNSANHVHPFSFTTNTQGSSATNANIQPYLTVKMWKRTA